MENNKKVDIQQKNLDTRYYWCVNCGHYGDYGYARKRNLNCEMCGYDDMATYTLEEISDPELDNIWLERFKKKEETSACNKELMETIKEAKELLNKKSVLDKIAEIRAMK